MTLRCRGEYGATELLCVYSKVTLRCIRPHVAGRAADGVGGILDVIRRVRGIPGCRRQGGRRRRSAGRGRIRRHKGLEGELKEARVHHEQVGHHFARAENLEEGEDEREEEVVVARAVERRVEVDVVD